MAGGHGNPRVGRKLSGVIWGLGPKKQGHPRVPGIALPRHSRYFTVQNCPVAEMLRLRGSEAARLGRHEARLYMRGSGPLIPGLGGARGPRCRGTMMVQREGRR